MSIKINNLYMRKKTFLFTLCSVLLLHLFIPLAYAQEYLRSGDTVELGRTEVIDNNFFAAGENVILSGTVKGDAYLAGSNVSVDGVVDGDVLVAGGNIHIGGTVMGDIRVVGGNIKISGNVGGNVTTAGGSVDLENSARITGGLVAAGGNIEVYAPITAGITAAGGRLNIANSVGSDIVAAVGDLSIASAAAIQGNLLYYSDKAATIQSQESIAGTVTHRTVPKKYSESREIAQKTAKNINTSFVTGFTAYQFITSLLIGLLLLKIFPVFMSRSLQEFNTAPFKTVLSGILSIFVGPVLIIALFITILGIPVSLLFLAGYITLLYLAHIITALLMGDKIYSLFDKSNNVYLKFILGLFILTLLSLLPVIGILVGFVSSWIGVGALVLGKYSIYQELNKKKLI